MSEKIDLIWNITKICPFDCGQCCVDAYHVCGNEIKYEGLNKSLDLDSNKDKYNNASKRLIEKGLELSLEDKMRVLKNLKNVDVEIDFSGGDPLVVDDNIEIIKESAKIFGKENISVTATGVGISMVDINLLGKNINQIEFTYDNSEFYDNQGRPIGYNSVNLKKAIELSKRNVKTKAQLPLIKDNIENIENIYQNLHKAGIDDLLLMRTFPVGRGCSLEKSILNKEEYVSAINEFKKLEEIYGSPHIKLQCALKNLYGPNEKNPCNLLESSLAITNTGLLILSAWAYDSKGNPYEDCVIGDLKKEKLEDLLNQPHIEKFRKKLDNNFGHCKIFAYVHSQNKSLTSLLKKTDPLYSKPYEV